mgnify:CR=1 FL=1
MSDLGAQREWRGLLRRLHDPWSIPPIDDQSAARYIGFFLDTYLGTISDTTALPERISELVEAWALRDAAVPLDMLAKYCHSRLCAGHAARLVAVEERAEADDPERAAELAVSAKAAARAVRGLV